MKMIMGGNSSLGQYIRFPSDSETIYVIDASLADVNDHPKSWLADDFMKVDQILSIQSSKVGDLESTEWAVTRKGVADEFALAAPLSGSANQTTVGAMKEALSYLRFNDVVSNKAAEGLGIATEARRVTLTTAQDFKYVIDFTPKVVKDSELVLMSFSVQATLTGDNDTEALKKKLAFEKSLEGKTFEVSKYSVETLLKDRSEVIEEKSNEVINLSE